MGKIGGRPLLLERASQKKPYQKPSVHQIPAEHAIASLLAYADGGGSRGPIHARPDLRKRTRRSEGYVRRYIVV